MNNIYKIAEDVLSKPFIQGENDCNILALRVLDEVAGTEWVKVAKYKTLKAGYKQLKSLGYTYTIDIIKEYADEVTHAIDGDIWVDNEDNHTLALVMSDRLVRVNSEHDGFTLSHKNNKGTYYRIRK
ncbi:TPA: ornithine carbamoyltransferase [Klebsiella pneumoniae]|uniref:DUF6950 family protein n=1 Tax=Klebsiella sp. JB_Kp029 TaxID=3153381 RepID=UPI0028CF02E9|nr:ornithine carbamoyltransferase [Klebsiella pneumoniae]